MLIFVAISLQSSSQSLKGLDEFMGHGRRGGNVIKEIIFRKTGVMRTHEASSRARNRVKH